LPSSEKSATYKGATHIVKPKLLQFVVCPRCHTSLSAEIHHRDGDEIMEAMLSCAKCQRTFPVSRGIPRFVPNLSNEAAQTTEGFGFEWNTFNEAIKSTEMSAEFLFQDFIAPVKPDFFCDKMVLDGGCGMGRFSMLAARWGAREVVAVDLGSAVEAAFQNTRGLPNVHVIQADLCELPLGQVFDYVFSVGVLHHTVEPRRSFLRIAELVKENGHLSAWVYSKEGNEWVERFITPARKHITSRLPKPMLLALSYLLGVILYAVIKLIYTPINKFAPLRPLRRVLFYNDYLFYLGRVGFRGVVSVIFDHLVPSLAAYISKDQLLDWTWSARFDCVSLTARTNNSWRLLASKRPVASTTGEGHQRIADEFVGFRNDGANGKEAARSDSLGSSERS
jgi:SAM-dependent methyltransferase